MNDLKTAKVKDTGKIIKVYKLSRRNKWCNYEDCKTEYSYQELEFIK